MNILYISPNSPFESIGGIERYLVNLINYSENQKDINTFVLLPSFSEEEIIVKNNVTVLTHRSLGLNGEDFEQGGGVFKKASNFAIFVEKIIQEQNIDVICAENFHLGLPAAFSLRLNMVAGFYGVPIVLRLHSFAGSYLQTELINQLMWKKISCVSRSVAGDSFHKGADIDLLSTNYLGVDNERFKPNPDASDKLRENLSLPSDSRIVLSATRIVLGSKNILKEKGLISMIRAFSRLSARHPEIYLLIAVGRPPKNLDRQFEDARTMLMGYLKLNNVESRSIVKTFNLDEMPDVYAGSDVFVLPSENETFGQVFIEAMASGIPVVGTNVGGIPEIINDSSNGYLVAVNNSTSLAQKIEKLMYDDKVRESFIRAGIETVENKFSSNQQFSTFNEMLGEVVEK
ncbi:MAG: glycosyltransferase family 4 protein [Candidatus Paceibacterota bacterium]